MRILYVLAIFLTFFLLFVVGTGKCDDDVAGAVADLYRVQQMMSVKKDLTWVFTGDSITQGAQHTYGMRSYPELFSERVRWEMRRKRDIVINTGVSGDTSEKLLSDLEWRVLRFKPDIVFVMIGTNDSTRGTENLDAFRKNVIELVNKVRQNGAVVVLNTPTPILSSCDLKRKDLPLYVEVLRELSKEFNVALIDHWMYWKKVRPSEQSQIGLFSDAVHPNAFGHRMMADAMFKSLNIYDPNSEMCKLFIP